MFIEKNYGEKTLTRLEFFNKYPYATRIDYLEYLDKTKRLKKELFIADILRAIEVLLITIAAFYVGTLY